MKLNSRGVLWILLLVTLVALLGGFGLRWNNEAHNKTVITTIDYREFVKSANFASQDIDTVLDNLQQAGVKCVAVKETTVRDLDERGDIGLYSVAEFRALMQDYGQDLWPEIEAQLKNEKINPSNRIIVSFKPETTEFLTERLTKRFTEEELLMFSAGNQDYFLVRSELIPQPRPANSMESPSPVFDARLGFDENLLDDLWARGWQIVLMPGQNRGSNLAYLQEYRDLVKKYAVNTIIIDGGQVPGYPEHLDVMQKLIADENLTLGIIETSVQLGYMEQKGLDEIMEADGYPINRVYSTRNDEFLQDVNDRYYRWIRAVVDRGIRIMYVTPFNDNKLTFSENLEQTTAKLDLFHQTITDKGYVTDRQLPPLNSAVPGKLHYFMVSLSLLLVTLLYLSYLARVDKKLLIALAVVGIALLAAANLLLGMDLAKLYALGAAIIYPSLSILLFMIYLRDYRHHSFLRMLFTSLLLLVGVNMLGGYTIVSSLTDIRYIMNVEYFRGVKIAFLLPLLLLGINYLACFTREEGVVPYLSGILRKSPSYMALALMLIAVVALYLYIGRSGHTAGVGVSSLELRLREILETLFLARPRFKEILIGYPALMALIYLYRRYPWRELVLILGLGVMMGSISMVNSFSHVFTAITVSTSRTLSGLIVGVAIGIITLIGIYLLEKIYYRWIVPYLGDINGGKTTG
ncbi:MAG: hypothetical protein GXY16_07345 [Syntrophomonadaceae bacterium]|nr:hypothetical protein [Syntrophomonadaceae bacterium]